MEKAQQKPEKLGMEIFLTHWESNSFDHLTTFLVSIWPNYFFTYLSWFFHSNALENLIRIYFYRNFSIVSGSLHDIFSIEKSLYRKYSVLFRVFYFEKVVNRVRILKNNWQRVFYFSISIFETKNVALLYYSNYRIETKQLTRYVNEFCF